MSNLTEPVLVMIRVLLLSVCAAAAASSVATAAAAPSGQDRATAAGRGLVGSPAPRMVLKTIDGQVIDLGSLYGKKAVYLKFWATWCVPCREQMPHFEHAFETAGPDLAVIAINAGFNDSLEDVQTYRKRLGIHMPIVIDDGTLGAALNLRVTPQHVIIGRDGRIQYVGHLADSRLDAALVAARTGAEVAATAKTSSGAASAGGGDSPHAADAAALGVGDKLPDLSVTTLNGRSVHLLDANAKRTTVLVFLSPWCESYLATSRPGLSANCRKVREQVETLAHGGNIRWLGIASGLWASRGELASYRDENKVTIDLTLDESGALFRTFRVMSVPTLLVVDPSGRIVRRIEGSDQNVGSELKALASAPATPRG